MRRRVLKKPDGEFGAIRVGGDNAGPRVCFAATLGILILFFAFNIIPVALDGDNVVGIFLADEAGNSVKCPKVPLLASTSTTDQHRSSAFRPRRHLARGHRAKRVSFL